MVLEAQETVGLPVAEVSNTFTKIPDCLLAATSICNTETGVVVSVSSNDKNVYAKMFASYKFHSASGREYFESQDVVADLLGLERKTVASSVKKFVQLGVVTTKIVYKNGIRHTYYVFDDISKNSNIVFVKRFTTRTLVDGKVEVENTPFYYRPVEADGTQLSLLNKRTKSVGSIQSRQHVDVDYDEESCLLFEQRYMNEFNNYEHAAMQFVESASV